MHSSVSDKRGEGGCLRHLVRSRASMLRHITARGWRSHEGEKTITHQMISQRSGEDITQINGWRWRMTVYRVTRFWVSLWHWHWHWRMVCDIIHWSQKTIEISFHMYCKILEWGMSYSVGGISIWDKCVRKPSNLLSSLPPCCHHPLIALTQCHHLLSLVTHGFPFHGGHSCLHPLSYCATPSVASPSLVYILQCKPQN